jgi:imidazolonepropionase-like amidohydrolase
MGRRPQVIRYLEAALSLGFNCKIHADQHSCGGAVSLAAEYRATSIDQLEYVTLDQARLLGSASALATLRPCASLRQGTTLPHVCSSMPAWRSGWEPTSIRGIRLHSICKTAVALACLNLA